ncbi:MAG: dihydroorotase family protein [Nocardioides sp.]|uniref:dihydroorotase n=1 Tax=Nocardioides sp. TaxID=35761 RepID=UPI0039E2BC57
MPELDLLVTDGTVVTADWAAAASVGISSGKIVYLGTARLAPSARVVLPVPGLTVLPGVIDAHVHYRDPGMPRKESFRTGSLASAVGGVTSIVDMPNTDPPPVDDASLRAKLEQIEERGSFVDYGVCGLIQHGTTPRQVDAMLAAGACGLNVFTDVAIFGAEPPDTGEFFHLLKSTSTTAPIGFLPETQALVSAERTIRATDCARERWLGSRVVEAENHSISSFLALANGAKKPLHVNHLSSGEGLNSIRRSRGLGTRVSCETSPHYLYFGRHDIDSRHRLAPISPPLRTAGDQQVLWAGVRDGSVDIVVSDHAPHESAELDRADLWHPSVTGFSGAELLVPTLLNAVHRGDLDLHQLVRATSANPSRLFGWSPCKGSIAPGADGDLTIVDLQWTKVVDSRDLHSQGKLTPFDGMQLTGWPRFTIVRGEIVVAEGEVRVAQPTGRNILSHATNTSGRVAERVVQSSHGS